MKTQHAPEHIQRFADSTNSSIEIAVAIYEIAQDGDEVRMWEDPTAEELAEVTARAWELADDDEDVLHWGVEKLRRA